MREKLAQTLYITSKTLKDTANLIMQASKNSSIDELRAIGVISVNVTDEKHQSPIFASIGGGKTEDDILNFIKHIVTSYADAKIQINMPNKYGNSPLQLALKKQMNDVANYLTENGAVLTNRDCES